MKRRASWLKRLLEARPLWFNGSRLAADDGQIPDVQGKVRKGVLRIMISNPPLLIGSVIVLALFLVTLFGPAWAPQNPYLTSQPISRYYDTAQRVLIDPPLPPSPEFPLGTDRWGIDLLSLLLHGARNTLVACLFIASVRILLGVLIGGIAGWNEGRFVDQLSMGAVGVVTAVPALISSVFLIFALDIRRGLVTFILALSIVGWTEIAQYIRGEFLVLRKMPYIEGARASGMGAFSIAVRQVLPNLLPNLLVLGFLEMGAVMMLLGELGFIGVYIGGGSRVGVDVAVNTAAGFRQQVFQLIEVPEWGAMLAEGFRFLRSKPFVVFPPAIAFFVAVVGFNTFGDGLRRHIETYGLNTGALLRKRSLLFFAAVGAATVFVINRTGPAPWFERVAHAFQGERALEQARSLAALEGRGHGQPGGEQAVTDILAAVQEYGLEPGWQDGSYIYPLPAMLVRPLEQPALELLPSGSSRGAQFIHQTDFAYLIAGHAGGGEAQGALTFIGFLGDNNAGQEAYAGLDLRGKIVLLQEGNAPTDFPTEALIRGAKGVIWITRSEESPLHSQTLKLATDSNTLLLPQIPIFRIRPSTARMLLGQDGLELADLFDLSGESTSRERIWTRRDLEARVRMSLKLQEPQPYEVKNVLGYLQGSDVDHADEMVVLYANYDGLGMDPDGTVFPGANNDGSGVALLLELARLWQQEGLQPRRSVLFVFWGTGSLDNAGARDFLRERFNFRHLLAANNQAHVEPSVIYQFEGVGSGGDLLTVSGPAGDFLDVLEETAQELNLNLMHADDGGEQLRTTTGTRLPWIQISWVGSAVPPQADRAGNLDAEHFNKVGELAALTLAKILRQTEY
ncbi:MAG: ABC transporter permease subunit [Anaerolineales bacterium]|jgi:peptide/nickel transport system permease protein